MAQKFTGEFKKNNIRHLMLMMGDMFNLPIADNAYDIVYTRQAVEPNGGYETEILRELYRITNEYLILIEPAYDLADDKAKRYMEKHGYIKDLYGAASKLELPVITWELYGVSENPLNPVGLMIIEKKAGESVDNPLRCPITRTELVKTGNVYFSPRGLLSYPIVNDVPCLLSDYALVTTKMDSFY